MDKNNLPEKTDIEKKSSFKKDSTFEDDTDTGFIDNFKRRASVLPKASSFKGINPVDQYGSVAHFGMRSESLMSMDSKMADKYTSVRLNSSDLEELTESEKDKPINLETSAANLNLSKNTDDDYFKDDDIGLDEIRSKWITNEPVTNEEIESHKEEFKEFHQNIVVANEEWIKKMSQQDPKYFENLAKPQKPKYLVIACSDSRVVVNEFTGTDPGDAFTHRNIGNLVMATDFNCQSVIHYAVQNLKVEHIMVIGHSDCGAVKASVSQNHHGFIDFWLRKIRDVAEKYMSLIEAECKNTDDIVKKLIEYNVREQCLNLCKNPVIQAAWNQGQRLYIHGYVFEMHTGKLKHLSHLQQDWDEVKDIYKFNFQN